MLRNCLASLLHQDQGARIEVVVVDNASSDGAVAMMERDFPEVRLLANAENRGFSKANNQAAFLARGRTLFFLNNDTVVPPGTIGKLLAYLDAHPEISILGPRLRDGAGQLQTSYREKPMPSLVLSRTWWGRLLRLQRAAYRRYRRSPMPTEPTAVHVIMGAAMLMRRDIFDTIGGWDEGFSFGGEDMEICLRAEKIGSVVYHPGIELTHLGRVSTRLHASYSAVQFPLGYVRYFRKVGCSRSSVMMYKLGILSDAPMEVLILGTKYLWNRLRGKSESAARCRGRMRETIAFLWGGFWPILRA